MERGRRERSVTQKYNDLLFLLPLCNRIYPASIPRLSFDTLAEREPRRRLLNRHGLYFIEEELQLFIGKVDADLLKAVVDKFLKSKNVQNTCC